MESPPLVTELPIDVGDGRCCRIVPERNTDKLALCSLADSGMGYTALIVAQPMVRF